MILAGNFFIRGKRSAKFRSDLHGPEKTRGGSPPGNANRVTHSAQVVVFRSIGGQVLKQMTFAFQGREVPGVGRRPGNVLFGIGAYQINDTIRILKRKGLQKNVQELEDRGVCSDTERKREDDHPGVTAIAQKCSDTMPEIA